MDSSTHTSFKGTEEALEDAGGFQIRCGVVVQAQINSEAPRFDGANSCSPQPDHAM